MPCSTPYEGVILDAHQYLVTNRPRGWLEEIEKLQDMMSEGKNVRKFGQEEFQVRFRHISPGVILPQQVRMSIETSCYTTVSFIVVSSVYG